MQQPYVYYKHSPNISFALTATTAYSRADTLLIGEDISNISNKEKESLHKAANCNKESPIPQREFLGEAASWTLKSLV